MTITWQHTSLTLLLALALHGSVAIWLALPTPEPLPEPPVQQLRISLLATVAEITTAAPSVASSPPAPKPPPPAKPAPPPTPEPVPKPVIQKLTPKPEPIPELPKPEPPPIAKLAPPQLEPMPVKAPLEPVEKPEPIAKPPALAESGTAPLDAVATAKYEQLLVAWLEKHKKYPRRAKRMRIEGEGWLRILIDRTGAVQQVKLEQRTGNRLLDKAVLEMAAQADPFPPMPENDPRQELEFIVPVLFALR